MPEVIATLTPRPARRWIGIGLQCVLGLLLVWVASLVPNDSMVLRVTILALGVLAVLGAVRVHRATSLTIELTETELRDSAGKLIARVDDIRHVDRGALAIKPSNGFLLTLESGGPFHWAPGLWWRVGRFVGVGGVTPAGEGKFMAELLSGLVAQRRAG